MKVTTDCSDQEPWFEFEVRIEKGQPTGFKEWVKGIHQCKYRILLPDGTRTDAKIFMDLQQRFDNNAFTKYLLNRYEEL